MKLARTALALLSVSSILAPPALAAPEAAATGHSDGICLDASGHPLAVLSRSVADARRRIRHAIDPHIVTTLLLMVPASQFDHSLRRTCAASAVAIHPDVARMAFTWRYEKMPFVSPGELAFNQILLDQYVSFREADAAYHAWTARVGERAGDWVNSVDQSEGHVERSARAAAWATGAQSGLDLLALGPDLVCLPENVALSPWMLGHGALESFCGGFTFNAKRVSRGTGEAIGAVLHVLTVLVHADADALLAREEPRLAVPESAPVRIAEHLHASDPSAKEEEEPAAR